MIMMKFCLQYYLDFKPFFFTRFSRPIEQIGTYAKGFIR